jgi:hypothetical protein
MSDRNQHTRAPSPSQHAGVSGQNPHARACDRDRHARVSGQNPHARACDRDRHARVSGQNPHARASLAWHLARGAVGFGLIGAALALTTTVGPIALLFAPCGMVALRGCPMCWVVGLAETVSAGRLQRTCAERGCTLRTPTAAAAKPAAPTPGRSR